MMELFDRLGTQMEHQYDACRFLIGRQRTGVQYYVNSVICSPDKSRAIMNKGKG